ncbi:Hydrogenase maturation protein HypD [Candidatus Thermokryptus mobilis]|uniref:Hydrogenase maturation protein HypD n=1 Tax=Candidatus Thermokryptus mobilis TaxID=1643428 RepID=A0A0S4N246_9BACT|nr:hydrogenase formation protein HypD [Candidatus Thermokryptus mobilis]CUU05294.1 Hydrogenase maturation protein HypD [Candidatus Thermokryptus mobilis]
MDINKLFRDVGKIKVLEGIIKREIEKLGRTLYIMEFCGGHTHVIMRYGIDELLSDYVKFVHGPGCPVCVLPMSRVDLAIELAKQKDLILCTYGDVMRVPGSNKESLLVLKAEGYNIKMLYSCLDAIKIAERNPDKQVVFFAIGFETTTPQTALLILQANEKGAKNLSVVSNHVITPAAIQHILNAPEMREIGKVKIDAFIGPGHVSTIIGTKPYEYFAEEFLKPVVISGFEPLDIMQSVFMIVKQIVEKRAEVEIQYSRFVSKEGNLKAQLLVSKVFELRKEFEWRGLGVVPYSSLKIRKEYSDFDAEKRFPINLPKSREHPACICAKVIRGVALPTDCKLFGRICNPLNPIGSCMVSSEGTCAAYYNYKVMEKV